MARLLLRKLHLSDGTENCALADHYRLAGEQTLPIEARVSPTVAGEVRSVVVRGRRSVSRVDLIR